VRLNVLPVWVLREGTELQLVAGGQQAGGQPITKLMAFSLFSVGVFQGQGNLKLINCSRQATGRLRRRAREALLLRGLCSMAVYFLIIIYLFSPLVF
jgi:hypothetical protein